MRMPATRTARGDARPAKETSRASVKAMLLEGATFATEATVSPKRPIAPESRPGWPGPCCAEVLITANPPILPTRPSIWSPRNAARRVIRDPEEVNCRQAIADCWVGRFGLDGQRFGSPALVHELHHARFRFLE